MKITFIGFVLLFFCSISISANAAISTTNHVTKKETTTKSNLMTNIKFFVKKNVQSVKRITSKKVKQLKKEYREMNAIRKVGLGIGMIIAGALVTVGSILTLSGWWFVIGLGLVIFGAFKIVFGVLGGVLNPNI